MYLKDNTDSDLPWLYLEAGTPWTNFADDDDLDTEMTEGAQVLRVGYGERS